ncbi:MAG: HEAT repeat domain-containing protein [Planctomycetota bacterium]
MPNLPFRPPPSVQRPARRPVVRPPWYRRARVRRWLSALRKAPAFFLSAVVHAVVLIVLAATAVEYAEEQTFQGVLRVGLYKGKAEAVEPEPQPEPEPEPEPEPAVEPEPEPQPEPPTPPSPDPEPQVQPEPAVIEAPPVAAVEGEETAARDVFAARSPVRRRQALRRHGGSPGSEKAVDAGLIWLHHHQDPETGSWTAGDPRLKLEPGLTGMALLAFLGKGHTHAEPGPYRDTVDRGIDYLLGLQSANGRFGEPRLVHAEVRNRYLMYHQALATLALAEAHALTRDPKLAGPLRRAVAFLERTQQDGGGWDYGEALTGRNDTSITGWVLMALKSAHAAGVEVGWQTLFGAMRHLEAKTTPLGEVVYADRSPAQGRRGPGMVAVGMVCYQILGWPRDSELLARQGDLLLRELPDWEKMTRNTRDHHLHTMYYWYYGTLAMFNLGGSWWRTWNARLRDGLIARQRKDGEHRGSWDPPRNGFDSVGGRVYTTALNVLNLEIYYRYLPFYSAPPFDALDVLEKAARVRGSGLRRAAIRFLKHFPGPRAEALLAAALDDPDRAARTIARRTLVELGSERAVQALLRDLKSPRAFTRAQAVQALARYEQERFVPHFIQALRDPERIVRQRAVRALRKCTGEQLGFGPDDPPAERLHAVALWERWWRGASAPLPPEGIRGEILVVDPRTPDAVVLSVGRDQSVSPALRFEVLRDGERIAVVEADRVQPTLTIARIVGKTDAAVREGDAVRSLPEPTVTEAEPAEDEATTPPPPDKHD